MNIDIYTELKAAIIDALTEFYRKNNLCFEKVNKAEDNGINLLTVKQFCEKHKFVTVSALRAKINFKEYNTFSFCVSKCGRRVLIKEKEALEWFSNPPEEANWTYDRKKYGHDK